MAGDTIRKKQNGGRLRFRPGAPTISIQYRARGCNYGGQLHYVVLGGGYKVWALFIRGLFAATKVMDYTRYELLH